MKSINGNGNTGSLTIRDGPQCYAGNEGRGTEESKQEPLVATGLEDKYGALAGSKMERALYGGRVVRRSGLDNLRGGTASIRPAGLSRDQKDVMLAKRDEAQREWDLFVMENDEPFWSDEGIRVRHRLDYHNRRCMGAGFYSALAQYLMLLVLLSLITPTMGQAQPALYNNTGNTTLWERVSVFVNVTYNCKWLQLSNKTDGWQTSLWEHHLPALTPQQLLRLAPDLFAERYRAMLLNNLWLWWPLIVGVVFAVIRGCWQQVVRVVHQSDAVDVKDSFTNMSWDLQGTVSDARRQFMETAINMCDSSGLTCAHHLTGDAEVLIVPDTLHRLTLQQRSELFDRGKTVITLEDNPTQPAFQSYNTNVTFDGAIWNHVGNGNTEKRILYTTYGPTQNLLCSRWHGFTWLWLTVVGYVVITYLDAVQAAEQFHFGGRKIDLSFLPLSVIILVSACRPNRWWALVYLLATIAQWLWPIGVVCYDWHHVETYVLLPVRGWWPYLLWLVLYNVARGKWWPRQVFLPWFIYEHRWINMAILAAHVQVLGLQMVEWVTASQFDYPVSVDCPTGQSIFEMLVKQWIPAVIQAFVFSIVCWTVRTITFDVDQLDIGHGKMVRLYTPRRYRGTLASLVHIFSVTPVRPRTPDIHTANGEIAFVVTSVDRKGELSRAISLRGSNESVVLTEQQFTSVVALKASGKAAPSAGLFAKVVKQHTGADFTATVCGIAVQIARFVGNKYEHTQEALEPYTSYTVCPSIDFVAKPAMWAWAKPALPGIAGVPDINIDNERICIQRRVIEQQRQPKAATRAFMRNAAELFDFLLSGQQRLDLQTPDEVRERQHTIRQKELIDKAEYNYMAFPFEDAELETEPFMKREAYGEIGKDARNITPLSARPRLVASAMSGSLADLYKSWEPYAFGMSPKDVAQRVANVAVDSVNRGSPWLVETDFSRFDGTQSKCMRQAHKMFFVRAFKAEYREEVLYVLSTLYGNVSRSQFGLKYEQGYGQASGDPFTSFINTLSNMICMYNALREYGATHQEALAHMGIYGGDDGVTPVFGQDPQAFIKHMTTSLDNLGYKIKPLLRTRGECVTFLARYYGPAVWEGDTNSMTDPLRAIRGFFLTTMSKDAPQLVVARCKAMSARVMDLNTPVFGHIVRHYLRLTIGVNVDKFRDKILANRSYNETWALSYYPEGDGVTDFLPALMTSETLVKNVEEDWMWDIIQEQLGGADLTKFFEWCDSNEIDCIPLCAQAPELPPKEENMIDGAVLINQTPREDVLDRAAQGVKDPIVKQAILDAVDRQQGEEDAQREREIDEALSEEDDGAGVGGPAPPVSILKEATRKNTARAETAHLQKNVGVSTPGKERAQPLDRDVAQTKRCRFGAACKKKDDCKFDHTPGEPGACREYKQYGKCKWGAKCNFTHKEGLVQGGRELVPKGACRNFYQTGKCSFGVKCKFNHQAKEPEAVQQQVTVTTREQAQLARAVASVKANPSIQRKAKEISSMAATTYAAMAAASVSDTAIAKAREMRAAITNQLGPQMVAQKIQYGSLKGEIAIQRAVERHSVASGKAPSAQLTTTDSAVQSSEVGPRGGPSRC